MGSILRIIVVVMIACVISWLIATPMTRVLYKYRHHDARRLTEIFENNTPYDLLFIGSSRTHRSIYPKLIDSICGVNSYNAGMESGALPDFKIIFDGYMVSHPPPKVLVLTLDLNSFTKSEEIHFYPQYYPYLKNKALHATLSKYGYSVNLVKIFPFIMITDFDDYSKENAIQKLRGRDTTDIPEGDFEYKGFISNSDIYIRKTVLQKINKIKISDGSVDLLNEMIRECRDHNVKIIFTYAPEYNFNIQRTTTNADSVFSLINRIANKNNIPFIRDDSLELCKNPMLFANNGHLNRQGAIVYSAILAKELNQILTRDRYLIH